MLKVLLIVVQGKPEGKTIPIVGSVFRVGRGEDCHLRPTSEEVSRRHAEFRIEAETVTVADLGSRNGTKVNGKLLTGPHTLKGGELVQIGPLTFAVAIQGAAASQATPSPQPAAAQPAAAQGAPPVATAAPAVTPARTAASLDDVPTDQIDAWLVSDNSRPTPDRPSGVYDGETLTIPSYRDAKASPSSGSVPKPKPAPEPEPEPVSPFDAVIESLEPLEDAIGDDEPAEEQADDFDRIDSLDPDAEPAAAGGPGEELIDESNPFYAKKAAAAPEAKPSKPAFESSSDAANDILRRMLDRRRGTPS